MTLTKTGKIIYTTLSWIKFMLTCSLVIMIAAYFRGYQSSIFEGTIGLTGIAYGLVSLICFTWFEVPTRVSCWEARFWKY